MSDLIAKAASLNVQLVEIEGQRTSVWQKKNMHWKKYQTCEILTQMLRNMKHNCHEGGFASRFKSVSENVHVM